MIKSSVTFANYRIAIIFSMICITAISAWTALGLRIDMDFISLLDSDSKAVKEFKYATENFKVTDSFVVIIDSEGIQAEVNKFITAAKQLDNISSVNFIAEKSSSIVLINPDFKSTELEQTKKLSNNIHNLITSSKLSANITGSYQVLLESSGAINRDMLKSAAITLAGILLLLLFFLRLPIATVLSSALCLIIGLCMTFALTRIFIGSLNLLTATLPSVIMGLGVDFCLHIVYAFNEKALQLQKDGDSFSITGTEYIETAYSKIAKPMYIGALTTVGAFLSLCFSKSDGLAEMGITGACGIGSMFICVSLLLPVLLSFINIEKHIKIRRTERFWLNLLNFITNKHIIVDILLLMIVVASGFYCSKVDFNSSQNELADQNIQSIAIQNKLLTNNNFSPVPVIFVSPDTQTEGKKLAFLYKQEKVFSLLYSYSISEKLGINANNFVGKDGTILTLAYPTGNSFESQYYQKIDQVVQQVQDIFNDNGNIITGSALINANLNSNVKDDLKRSSIAALFIIIGIVTISLYKYRDAIISLIPVSLAAFITIGMMGAAGIDLNIVTIVIFPLILGAGIDDGIHIFCRYKQENHDINETVSSIANPLLATTITSMIAFGSLTISPNPGFRQLGTIALTGMGACLIVSLVILPVYLRRNDKNSNN